MHDVARAFMAFVAAVAAYLVTLWLVGALLLPDGTPMFLRLLLALAAAIWAARYVWRKGRFESGGLASAIVTGALVVGGIGFCAGFFGPLIFAPDANQGPLLGILITGPLGAVVGAVAGAIRWAWSRRSGSSA